MRPGRILETCLYVDDLEGAEAFYSGLLGLEVHSRDAGRHLFLRCGENMLLLFRAEATERPHRSVPVHGARGPGHIAFAVTAPEIEAWRSKLEGAGVEIEKELRWPGGGASIYFRDPAGNSLEFATADLWD